MFLIMGMTMAIGSAYIEIKLVHGSAMLDSLYTKGVFGIKGVYFNTAGSFFLSWFIGMLFAADGVTVFFAGMISTGISQVYFSTEGWARENGWTMAQVKSNITGTIQGAKNFKQGSIKLYNDFRQPVADVVRFILIIMRIITFPFVMLRKASALYSDRRAT